jgi:hypothetical protein
LQKKGLVVFHTEVASMHPAWLAAPHVALFAAFSVYTILLLEEWRPSRRRILSIGLSASYAAAYLGASYAAAAQELWRQYAATLVSITSGWAAFVVLLRPTVPDRWQWASLLIQIVSEMLWQTSNAMIIALSGRACVEAAERPPWSLWLLVWPHVGMALCQWANVVCAVRRHRAVSAHKSVLGLLIFSSSFAAFTGRSISLTRRVVWRQYSAAAVGAVCVWAASVALTSDRLRLPSTQQWMALPMRIVLMAIYQTISLMVVEIRVDACS